MPNNIVLNNSNNSNMTTELKTKINVCYTLHTNTAIPETYEDLYEKLKSKYHRSRKDGIMCYEYYNANLEMIKPHIDYEEYADVNSYCPGDADDIQDQLEEVLCRVF